MKLSWPLADGWSARPHGSFVNHHSLAAIGSGQLRTFLCWGWSSVLPLLREASCRIFVYLWVLPKENIKVKLLHIVLLTYKFQLRGK
jgi:hypothetical protein